jgi:PEP-CTERM motif
MRVGRLHLWTCAVIALLAPSAVRAASISYGNSPVIPPGVTFINVTESSGTDAVPLYGPPSYFTTGVDFDPTGFVATANGGAADLTDGQLNFTLAGTVTPSQIVAIDQINLFESGDYTLVGTGTAATQVIGGASINVKVTEIDGIDVPDIVLPQVNASVSFNLVANPGVLQPWSVGAFIDINTALTSLFVDFEYGATEVEVVINDTLIAISQPASIAFIAKKDFSLDVDGILVVVPEPTSAGLLALSVLGIVLQRRRR